MSILISLIPILGIALFYNIKLKKLSSVALFFSMTTILTILYLFGLVEFLKIGASFIYAIGGGSFLYFLVKESKKSLEFFKSVPIVIFLILSLFYFYKMQDALYFFWDEFMHWGIFIKETVIFDRYYDANSVSAHLNYPPGMTTWSYFVLFLENYKEGYVFFAYFILAVGSTLMIYQKLSFKQIHWILAAFIVQMSLFATFGHWFNSILVDHIISAIFIGIMLSFLFDKFTKFEYMLFIFPLISIVLVKEVGFYFGATFLVFAFLYLLLTKQKNLKPLFLIFIILLF
jgi:hypothetical protein